MIILATIIVIIIYLKMMILYIITMLIANMIVTIIITLIMLTIMIIIMTTILIITITIKIRIGILIMIIKTDLHLCGTETEVKARKLSATENQEIIMIIPLSHPAPRLSISLKCRAACPFYLLGCTNHLWMIRTYSRQSTYLNKKGYVSTHRSLF